MFGAHLNVAVTLCRVRCLRKQRTHVTHHGWYIGKPVNAGFDAQVPNRSARIARWPMPEILYASLLVSRLVYCSHVDC